MKKVLTSLDNGLSWFRRFVSSDKFFYLVLALFLIQALWFAISVQPRLFDEPYHLKFIQRYAEQFSPFISNQGESWNSLGDVTRTPSYLYHYLLSWPLRGTQLVTDSHFAQVFVLRLCNIALVAGGLIVLRKLFQYVGSPAIVSNVVLLFLILIPTFPTLAGAINYDNATFFILPLILLMILKAMKSLKVDSAMLSGIVMLSIFVVLVKYTVAVILLPILAIFVWKFFKKHRHGFVPAVIGSFKALSVSSKVLVVAGLLISIGLFIERPVMNFISYNDITPSCERFRSQESCRENYTQARNFELLAKKPADFKPFPPFEYFSALWFPSMVSTSFRMTPLQPVPSALHFMFFSGVILGILLIVYCLRDLLRTDTYKILLLVGLIFIAGVFASNYASYKTFGAPVAMNGRYLLPALPFLLFFIALSTYRLSVKKYKNITTAILILILLLFTQGGGIITSVAYLEPKEYWKNSRLTNINLKIGEAIRPYIKDNEKYLSF